MIDLVERQHFGYELVDLELAFHVVFDIARQLRAAFHAAECRAAPDAAGHELERTRRDFLARAGDADDGRFTPALVAALERRTHHLCVADAFERIVDAAVG